MVFVCNSCGRYHGIKKAYSFCPYCGNREIKAFVTAAEASDYVKSRIKPVDETRCDLQETKTMTKSEYRETLEKQLQLLSERSEISDTDDLPSLTGAMIDVCKMLTSEDFPSEVTAKEFCPGSLTSDGKCRFNDLSRKSIT